MLESKLIKFQPGKLIYFPLEQNLITTFLTQKDLEKIRSTNKESMELIFQQKFLFNLKSAKDEGDFDKLKEFISKLNYSAQYTLSLPTYITNEQLKSILEQKLAKGDSTVGKSVVNLNLSDCRNLTDKSAEYLFPLANILSLDISKCDKLVKAKFSTKMMHLDISHCRKLKGENLEQMNSLQSMRVNGSASIIKFKVPGSVKHLDLSMNNKSIDDIQEMINKCQNLEYLNISGRIVGKELNLPETVTSVNFSKCENFTHSQIQKTISLCPNLKNLNLSGCELEKNIELPRSIKSLDLSGCAQLNQDQIQRMISQCPSLESLNLSGCELERNLDLPGSVKSLNISYCKKLNDYQVQEMINQCSNLEELNLSSCQIKELTFSKSVNFKKLTILNCETLKTLTFLEDANIGSFNINHCKQLETINIEKNIKVNNSNLMDSEDLKKMLKGFVPRSIKIIMTKDDPSPSLKNPQIDQGAKGR